MGNIKIINGVFDTKLELEHAGIKAGFPSPADLSKPYDKSVGVGDGDVFVAKDDAEAVYLFDLGHVDDVRAMGAQALVPA